MSNILIVDSRRGTLVKTTTGALTLDAQLILKLADRETYIRQNFRRLIGKGITQNQAAIKYDIPQRTISRWAASGHISKIGVPDDDPTAVLIDEADVAYCAAAYRAIGTRPGQKVFNKDGSLYIPKELGLHLLQPA